MDKLQNVKDFKKLYHLLNFYYENREQPVEEGFNFLEEVKTLCDNLELDYDSFIEEMHLNNFFLD